MSGVGIYLLNAFIINNPRPVIRIDRSRDQFHLLHGEIAPDAHPAPAPKRPEPASHLRLLPLARFEPALRLPRFGVGEDVRAAVQRVGLGAHAHAGG